MIQVLLTAYGTVWRWLAGSVWSGAGSFAFCIDVAVAICFGRNQ
jgi:hypothetical protein